MIILFPVVAAAVVTIEGTVIDGDPNAAIRQLQGVEVQIGTDADPVAYGSSITDATGAYTATGIPAGNIRLTFILANYVTTHGDYSPADGELLVADAALAPDSGTDGNLTGNIIDATDGSPVAGASLQLCEHINQSGGTCYGPYTSTIAGAFTINGIPAGTYTLNATAGGYYDDSYQTVSVGLETINYPDLVMAPVLAAGEIRIVLSWGPRPTDLDSHLYTPNINGSTYHIYWASRGNLGIEPFAELDIDDVTSYGPETITIEQTFAGDYDYKVYNFSGEFPLSDSGAIVKVYDDTGLIAQYNVPPESYLSEGPRWWFVFTLDGSTGQIISRDTPASAGSALYGDDGHSSRDNVPGSSACFIQTAGHRSRLHLWLKTLYKGIQNLLF
jgi:hypothetical protein